jgi:hypothetical protein
MEVGVLLLGGGPLGTQETFQKRLPAKGSLFTERILDGALQVKGWRREVVAPSVQGGEDRPGDRGVGIGAVEVPTELLERALPDRCHLGSGAMSNMLRGFIGARAARALSRVLGFDLVHLVTDAAEARSMFDWNR